MDSNRRLDRLTWGTLVAALIAAPVPALAAKWVSVVDNAYGRSLYLDSDSVQRGGSEVQVWTREVFVDEQRSRHTGVLYYSASTQVRFDCGRRTIFPMTRVFYGADGTELRRVNLDQVDLPEIVTPGSLQERLLEEACKQPAAKKPAATHVAMTEAKTKTDVPPGGAAEPVKAAGAKDAEAKDAKPADKDAKAPKDAKEPAKAAKDVKDSRESKEAAAPKAAKEAPKEAKDAKESKEAKEAKDSKESKPAVKEPPKLAKPELPIKPIALKPVEIKPPQPAKPQPSAVEIARAAARASGRVSPAYLPAYAFPPRPRSHAKVAHGEKEDKAADHEVHWSYEGATGPEHWAKLKPEYAACGNGKRQSPIDIHDGAQLDLEPIRFDYRPSPLRIIDNGHTVQVNYAEGSSIMVSGVRYDLKQFHFHKPSEERVNGKMYEMVAHLVHQSAEGRLAVIAVLMEGGSGPNDFLTGLWPYLPLESGREIVPADVQVDIMTLLPHSHDYFTYMGSLTTPPCSEGVLWLVMKQPVPISAAQVSVFGKLYRINARPVQPANGRLIKESL
jgi:carbonic anhydrase